MRHRNIIGPQVRRLRNQRGGSQEQLAAKLQIAGWDLSRNGVAKIEDWIEYELTSAAEKFHRREPRAAVLPLPGPQQPAHPAGGAAGAGRRRTGRPSTRSTPPGRDARRQRRPAARELDELGLRDRTIVVFTSDNGGLHVPERRARRADAQHPLPRRQGLPLRGRPARAADRPLAPASRRARGRRAGGQHRLDADAAGAGGRAAGRGLDGVSLRACWPAGKRRRRGRSTGTSRTTPTRAAGPAGRSARATGSWSSTTRRASGTVRSGRGRRRDPRPVEGRGGTDRCLATSGCASGEASVAAQEGVATWRRTSNSTTSCTLSSIRRASIRFAPTARPGRQ